MSLAGSMVAAAVVERCGGANDTRLQDESYRSFTINCSGGRFTSTLCMTTYGQGPGPGVKSKNPDTVPLNAEEVVVPVVLTTTTKSECAGTVNE